MAKAKILGTGGAFSKDTTSYLLNDHILIDCSSKTINELNQDEISKIDVVIFTHQHNDHIGGLSQLLEYKRYILNDTNLKIYAGGYFLDHYMNLGVSKNNSGFIIDFNYQQIKENLVVQIDDIEISFHEVQHCSGEIETHSIDINTKNNRLIISSDVDDNSVLDFVKSLNLVNKKDTKIFMDMGWTGLPIVKDMVHPREETIKYQALEVLDYVEVIGIHTDAELKYFRKAMKNEIYEL